MDISVILPVRDGASTLASQLAALASQTYNGEWELIVADNGSSDRSAELAEAWRDRISHLVVLDASHRRGRAAACNAAVRVARADVFAFCDADDIASPRWVEVCVKASRTHDFVAGALDHYALDPSAPPWKRRVLSEPPRIPGGSPFADGANMVVSRTAFEAVGGFGEDLLRAADVDLSWRLEAAGYSLHFEPAAPMAKRGRSSCRDVWRQSAEWGAAEATLRYRYGASGRLPQFMRIALLVRALLRDPRLRDRRILLALLHPKHYLSWVAATARVWGRLRALPSDARLVEQLDVKAGSPFPRLRRASQLGVDLD